MIVIAPSNSVLEAEPNDTFAQAHALGDLAPGQTRAVLGSITDAGSDPFDGFRLTATERVSVDLQLVTETMTADLDVYVIDPVSMQFVERFETMSASESGTFIVDGPFFVAVTSFSGASTYELRLTATAAQEPIAELEPNDVAGDAMYLGTLGGGETVELSGSVGGGDVSDRFLVALPAAGPFEFALVHDGGNDFDVTLRDATGDVLNPILIQAFQAGTSPEVGMIDLTAMALIEVEIIPFSGSGPWALALQAGSSLHATSSGGAPSAAAPAALSTSRRGDVAIEPARIRSKNKSVRFGDVTVPLWTGDLIVSPSASNAPGFAAEIAARGGRVVAEIQGGPRKVTFDLPTTLDDTERARYTVALAATLSGMDGVAYAEPDYRVFPLFDTRPNDTHYNLQWHYEQIQLPAAWDVTTGNNNVIVAVLDTGTTPHPDLVSREIQGIDMISNPAIAGDGNGIDNDPTDVGDSNGAQPSSFHGSHVGGTIGASTNDSQGVAGVTWFGRMMHVRVLGIGGGSTFDILNGIRWAARLSNTSNQLPAERADIINMSLGGPSFSQATQDAVTAARNEGVVVIAAAGNENSPQPSFPAAYDDVLSVAAVDFEGNRAPYSNFHATVDIAAPGGDVTRDRNGDGYADGVLSTKPDDTVNPTNFTSYSFYQGTSMAAPHVAGVAALILAVNPALTPAQVENILTSTATDRGAPGRDDEYGNGLVNAFAAVQSAGGGGGGAPVLSLASQSVLFSERTDSAQIGVANVGGGMLDVTNVSATTSSGGAWLSAVPVPVTGGMTTNTSAVEVTVSAVGLADGFYSGTVDITSNGGNASLVVTLALGASSGQVYTVYVLAVDAATFTSVAQDTVQTSSLVNAYSLADLPPGEYYIVAGTDEDNDNFICDPGEPLCGIYPSLELPSVVTVTSGVTTPGLDFSLGQAFLPASVSQSGYRLLEIGQEVGR
jgi:serine protease